MTHSLWKFRQNILTFSYFSEVIFFFFFLFLWCWDQTKAHARHEGGLLITNLWLRRQRLQLTAGVIRKSGIFFPRAVPCPLVLCVNAQRNDSPDNCPGFWVCAEQAVGMRVETLKLLMRLELETRSHFTSSHGHRVPPAFSSWSVSISCAECGGK